MEMIKATAIIFSLLLGSTGAAVAGSKHYGGHYYGGGCSDDTPSCTNLVDYTETFKTDVFKTKGKKDYGRFDAIDVPSLEIDSAVLTVNSNSNGWFDSFYLETSSFFGDYFSKIGFLGKDTTVFTLKEKWYDEVIAGLSFKAIFSKKSEELNWVELTVDGKYCAPPSAVPVPAAIWLFGPALMGFTAMRKRAKKA